MSPRIGPAILRLGPERVPQMDAQGIDVAALSINPFSYTAERDLASQIIAVSTSDHRDGTGTVRPAAAGRTGELGRDRAVSCGRPGFTPQSPADAMASGTMTG